VSATTELSAMPDIIIVAGPNGAGKTSFANEFVGREVGRRQAD
jgi:ABC-type Mn2+/Zn2+ transport system ATPase subunit